MEIILSFLQQNCQIKITCLRQVIHITRWLESFIGGDGGNRTHVQKLFLLTFSERS